LWLVRPSAFWSFVMLRVDYCGPCFVKLAQWLSTRRDIFPDTVCEAFSSLHNQVAARWSTGLTASEVEAMLRESSVPLRSLEAKAHASGSIAEVFFGTLEDGTDVAVKCLRPGVKALLEADLGWLLRLSSWAQQFETVRLLGFRKAAEDFVEHVQMQTDFEIEASHLRRFRENFSDSGEAVRFPAPLHVTPETLVLSRESGREFSHVLALREAPETHPELSHEDKRQLARQSMSAYMRMVFNDHFLHGDLHPGNIMLDLRPKAEEASDSDGGLLDKLRGILPAWPGTKRAHQAFDLVILDAGLAIPLPKEKVEVLRSLAISIVYSDYARAAEILYNESPDSSGCWDPAAFKSNLAKAFRDCRRSIWDQGCVQVSDTCLQALNLVQHYNVGLDMTLTWALFGMLSVEGSARQLDPHVDCAQVAMRYVITVPSLLKEMRHQSWTTVGHMVAELALQKFGLDYSEVRYQLGWTPFVQS